MAKQINKIYKSDEILIVEPYCLGYSHTTLNTILLLISNKLSAQVKFLSSESHIKIMKSTLKVLKTRHNTKFINQSFLNKQIFPWLVIYLINLFNSFFVIQKSKQLKVIFSTTDFTIFPIIFFFIKRFKKDKNTYYIAIHKGLNIFRKNKFILWFWNRIFEDPKINFIFFDKSAYKLIGKFKKIISNHERINILNFQDVEFNINQEEKNSINKVFCLSRDYNILIERNLSSCEFFLLVENSKYFLKNKKGEILEFVIINKKGKINEKTYLRTLNKCKYILINKSREKGILASGMRLDGLWSKKIFIEF